MNAAERELLTRMHDDAAANGDWQGAAELAAALTPAQPHPPVTKAEGVAGNVRLQLCLVCREPADTEAPLCKVCVADGASADDQSVTITLGPLTTPAQREGRDVSEQEAAAVLAELKRRIEAWIRHGEAVPSDVTTYDRWIVHQELRDILAIATTGRDQ